jgi:PTH1 family peptidyl-tRNA hydrolase
MALFQKKLEVGANLPIYTIGSNKTALIIGLGNPEEKFSGTRHNIGFAALDYFAEKNDFPGWINKRDLKCELTTHTLGDTRVVLCKPTTYMNLSGEAAQAVQHFYKVYNQKTLAVYDELAIKFGQLRTRVGGSDAGHNGVKSLTQHLGDDYARLRIGIGPVVDFRDDPSKTDVSVRQSGPDAKAHYRVGNEISEKADAANFVLGKFTKEEQKSLPLILRESNSLINEFIFSSGLPHETRNVL